MLELLSAWEVVGRMVGEVGPDRPRRWVAGECHGVTLHWSGVCVLMRTAEAESGETERA